MTTKDDLQRERNELLARIRDASGHNTRAVLQDRLNEVDRTLEQIMAEAKGEK